jgi:glycosyltransferase involved in cell wall biosynthesis
VSEKIDHNTPLISVVIPTYNRWPLILETLDSVTQQSFRDFEVIVIDDGSPDGTAARLQGHHPLVRAVRQDNTERGAAINHGISLATGAFVALLGDDDIFEPWHLAQFAEAHARDPFIRAYASGGWLWDPSTEQRVPLPPFDPSTLPRATLTSTAIAPQCFILSRSLLFEIGCFPADRSLAGSEDWLFIMKLAAHERVEPLPQRSVRIRQHVGRTMNNAPFVIASREAATRLVLAEGILGQDLDESSRRLVAAGSHRFCAAHLYGMGEMAAARQRLKEVRRLVGWTRAVPWTARLWIQTWAGPSVIGAFRHLRTGWRGARSRIRR